MATIPKAYIPIIIARRYSFATLRLARLVGENGAVVHIDAKGFQGGRFPNGVLRVSDPVSCRWASWSLVAAELQSIRMALREYPAANGFYLISDSCAPVKPLDDFYRELSLRRGMWLSARRIDCTTEGVFSLSRQRLHRKYLFDTRFGDILFRLVGERVSRAVLRRLWLPRSPRTREPVFVGSQWFSVDREGAQLLADADVNELKDEFSGVFAPDEVVLQTVLARAGKATVEVLEAESRENETIARLQNYHWLRSSMSGFLSIHELDEAIESPRFFARKVDLSRQELFSRVESVVGHS